MKFPKAQAPVQAEALDPWSKACTAAAAFFCASAISFQMIAPVFSQIYRLKKKTDDQRGRCSFWALFHSCSCTTQRTAVSKNRKSQNLLENRTNQLKQRETNPLKNLNTTQKIPLAFSRNALIFVTGDRPFDRRSVWDPLLVGVFFLRQVLLLLLSQSGRIARGFGLWSGEGRGRGKGNKAQGAFLDKNAILVKPQSLAAAILIREVSWLD